MNSCEALFSHVYFVDKNHFFTDHFDNQSCFLQYSLNLLCWEKLQNRTFLEISSYTLVFHRVDHQSQQENLQNLIILHEFWRKLKLPFALEVSLWIMMIDCIEPSYEWKFIKNDLKVTKCDKNLPMTYWCPDLRGSDVHFAASLPNECISLYRNLSGSELVQNDH